MVESSNEPIQPEQNPSREGLQRLMKAITRPNRHSMRYYQASAEFASALLESEEAVKKVITRYPRYSDFQTMYENALATTGIPIPKSDPEEVQRFLSEVRTKFDRLAKSRNLRGASR